MDPLQSPDCHERQAGHRGSIPLSLTGRILVCSWLTSVGVHGLLLGFMFVLVFPFAPRPPAALPDLRAELIGPIDAPLDHPSSPNPFSQNMTMSDAASHQPAYKTIVDVNDLTRFRKPDLSVIGIGAGGSPNHDGVGPGLGLGGGRADFFGLGGSTRGVRSVVYVVDRSGSMEGTFHFVQRELRRSINLLDRSQKFHVILFNEGPPLESPPKRLVNAVAAYKEQFFSFLEGIIPGGRTKPEAALRRALALEPDVVYLLSDGVDFQDSLLKRLDQWNPERRSRIHTIAYLDDIGKRILEDIARLHNGDFRFVDNHDLP